MNLSEKESDWTEIDLNREDWMINKNLKYIMWIFALLIKSEFNAD